MSKGVNGDRCEGWAVGGGVEPRGDAGSGTSDARRTLRRGVASGGDAGGERAAAGVAGTSSGLKLFMGTGDTEGPVGSWGLSDVRPRVRGGERTGARCGWTEGLVLCVSWREAGRAGARRERWPRHLPSGSLGSPAQPRRRRGGLKGSPGAQQSLHKLRLLRPADRGRRAGLGRARRPRQQATNNAGRSRDGCCTARPDPRPAVAEHNRGAAERVPAARAAPWLVTGQRVHQPQVAAHVVDQRICLAFSRS